jgi:2-keto-4-pentenoate hydratase/2-oxohepta-3-ene-1,7-dioic acid hydratase in catechol pathway
MTEARKFGLGTFAPIGGEPFPGLVLEERVIDLRPVLGPDATTHDLFEDWEASFEALAEIAAQGDHAASHAYSDLRPLPPLIPRQILCAGANYKKHVRQIVVSTLKAEGDGRTEDELRAEAERQLANRMASEPYMFVAPPSALCGALDDVVLWKPGNCHDWELELAIVIGRGGSYIDESDALAHVAGYTISNDISVRDVQHRPGFPMTDFVSSKGRPTYFPTGPYIVPREFVPDPRQLRVKLSVNDEVMQDESVDDIIYGVEQLVAYASKMVGLERGDLILTGSPAGNAGHHGNRWLVPGDVMVGEITGLGEQRNVCVAPD